MIYAALDGVPDLGPGDPERERLLACLPYLARTLIGADFGALTIIGDSGRITRMYASGISPEDADKIGPPPAGRGLLGLMVPWGKPLRIDRISKHARAEGLPAHHPPMESLLGVAVENDGRHAANLYLANRPGRPAFSEQQQALVEMMAQQAATALENARLYRQEERMRRETEAARREAEAASHWLEAVIAEARTGIIVVDAESGEVLLASPEAQRILGAPLLRGAAAVEYERAVRYLRPDGTPFDIADLPLQQAMATGQPAGPVEVIFDRPDGRRIPTLVSASPVPGKDGGGAVIVVFQDASRLKELDQVKSEFLSMITHDLRSPLAIIKGLTSAVISNLDPDHETRADLEAVNDEVDQMTELVSNLLDMSRIEAGSYPLERELCHMVDLADDAVKRARRSRVGERRTIAIDVASDLPPIYADPGQIGRVLDNLLGNALKYSDGEIRLQSCLASDNDWIFSEVSDHGIGVPADQLAAVFDKFFRVTGGMRAGRGAGLGLAICKSIVQAHGGEIGVDSKVNKGSSFWFTIPVHDKPAASVWPGDSSSRR